MDHILRFNLGMKSSGEITDLWTNLVLFADENLKLPNLNCISLLYLLGLLASGEEKDGLSSSTFEVRFLFKDDDNDQNAHEAILEVLKGVVRKLVFGEWTSRTKLHDRLHEPIFCCVSLINGY
uniref:Uncharacterized protein n=1 Tax=Solanum lycopersicum TaxID=4081 RepID=A0A3Q7JCW8_SOLLC